MLYSIKCIQNKVKDLHSFIHCLNNNIISQVSVCASLSVCNIWLVYYQPCINMWKDLNFIICRCVLHCKGLNKHNMQFAWKHTVIFVIHVDFNTIPVQVQSDEVQRFCPTKNMQIPTIAENPYIWEAGNLPTPSNDDQQDNQQPMSMSFMFRSARQILYYIG